MPRRLLRWDESQDASCLDWNRSLVTEIPCKSPPRTKARLKYSKKKKKKGPSLSINIMARADKSAAISKAFEGIRD